MTATVARLERERRTIAASRREEFVWLLLASVVVVGALVLVYGAKKQLAAESEARLAQRPVLNLNALRSERDLLPYLEDLSVPAEQSYVAHRIFQSLRGHRDSSVAAIARLRVSQSELKQHPDLTSLSARMAEQAVIQERENKKRLEQVSWLGTRLQSWRAQLFPKPPKDPSISLLSLRQFSNLKPWLTVRPIQDFRLSLLLYGAGFIAVFYLVHLFWRYRRFAGDNLILPAIHLLTGLGLVLMVSSHDPLRDSLIFTGFASGVMLGALLMAALALVDYDRVTSRFSFVFLAASILLGITLAIFGSGPSGSRAKVNLFFFQPVEVIRVLLVFFLAAYFASHWEVLRDLRHKSAKMRGITTALYVPRLDHLIPVLAGMLLAIGLFFYFQDLGPAVVIGFLFLLLYAVARNRVFALIACCLLFVVGLAAVHAFRAPDKVENRIEIWLQPWRNTVHNGDQIAQSLWALASGGWQGAGIGMGRPASVPAGQTDLVLAVAGEEYGFVGLLSIALLYWLLVSRAFRIALQSATPYCYFLVTGLNLIILLQLLLIAAGVLDAFPLSGVVSPFLSFGKTSMIANFAVFGIILAISSAPNHAAQKPHFGTANRVLGVAFGLIACALIVKAAYVQVVAADSIAVRDAEVVYAGEGGVGLDYNPRIKALIRDLPRGDIFDRNGIPLATGDLATVQQHHADYQRLGVNWNANVNGTTGNSKDQQRFYPLGPQFFYLVENFRSRELRNRLRGFDDRRERVQLGPNSSLFRYDYSELLPLLRHRYDPDNPQVRALMTRERDVKLSIDAALQKRASEIMSRNLAPTGKKGALVAIDAATGELLAAVSYPWPGSAQFAAYGANPEHELPEDMIDRARYGRYPPGSSFKLVTATAALRFNPDLVKKTYTCSPLENGRVGAYVNGVSRVRIRDDDQDHVPHGTIALGQGLTVSCNAYFAQIGTYDVGAQHLIDTAGLFGIAAARNNTPSGVNRQMPQTSYGQGEVLASPTQMARVAAAMANRGTLPPLFDEGNNRVSGPVSVLPANLADELAGFMRAVVTLGTGKRLAGSKVPIAGKTGTAEVSEGGSHAWFVGFAPYGATTGRKIAFAVLVEHGRYGGTAAAPIAGELVTAARELGLI